MKIKLNEYNELLVHKAQCTVHKAQTHTKHMTTTITSFEITPIFHQFDKQNDIEILLCREQGTRQTTRYMEYRIQSRQSKCSTIYIHKIECISFWVLLKLQTIKSCDNML